MVHLFVLSPLSYGSHMQKERQYLQPYHVSFLLFERSCRDFFLEFQTDYLSQFILQVIEAYKSKNNGVKE